MSETYEIALTVDGTEYEIIIEKPGPFTMMKISAQSPDLPNKEDIKAGKITPEMVEFVKICVAEITTFNPDKFDHLSMNQFQFLTKSTMQVFAGSEPDSREPPATSNSDDFRVDTDTADNSDDGAFAAFDLDENGTVDPGDWQ